MKKIVFMSLFVFFNISTVFSQGWYIGGNVLFQHSDNFDYREGKLTSIGISPSIGFIINNNFDMGLKPTFSTRINPEYYAGNDLSYGIGIFTRFSFIEINNFSIFGRVGLDYIYSSEYNNYNYDYSNNFISSEFIIDFTPVFQFNILNNLSIYTSIGSIYFSHLIYDEYYHGNKILKGKENNFGINFSTSISFGFHFVFGSSRNTYTQSHEQDTNVNQNNSQRQSSERIQSREPRRTASIPQLGTPTPIQQNINTLPAIPIPLVGKNFKFELGGDIWTAKVNGENFMAGNCLFEETDNGYIIKLKTTHVWTGAVEDVIDLLQRAGIPLGPAATPLRTAARLAARAANWIPLDISTIILDYYSNRLSFVRIDR